jgi:regulator of sigma E protease
MVLMQFIALLSINLALINILPFPALDGGRILFIALEAIFRKKVVKEKLENIIHTAGFVLLIVLMLLITYKDVAALPFIQKLFHR